MKTLYDLAVLVKEYESEQASGSETALLTEFLYRYGTVKVDTPITDEEYRKWDTAYRRQGTIEAYLEGIYNLSPKASEPYFSKAPCELCGAKAGERWEFTGRTLDNGEWGIVEDLSCCTECFGYLFT